VFLDLVQHYLLSVYEIDEKKRVKLLRELIGVPRLLQPDEVPSKIPRWAPAWWDGDEDATALNMAAMKALRRG
jgi:hypothetical protein